LATHDSQARSDARATQSPNDPDRDARIEQLLLAGLDEYFTGHYEDAINLWTRVLFIDRHHDRARAYIERARRAEAERQRETEAVLQQGIERFQQGDVEGARRLIADALDRGAAREDAQGLLERIDRLGAGQMAPPRRRASATTFRPPDVTAGTASPRRGPGWVAALLLMAAAIGVVAVGFLGLTPVAPSAWPTLTVAATPAPSLVPVATPGPLPVAAASETALSRSRALVETGRLHDALLSLDRIALGDPLAAEADALRTRIHRELLAVAAADPSAAPSAPPGSPPE
jgi:hypothetical protein